MLDTTPESKRSFQWSWFFLFGAGLCLLVGAWLLPISIGSVHPALLSEIAKGSRSVTDVGAELARQGKIGPARVLREAGASVGVSNFETLDVALANHSSISGNARIWNGHNPLLDAGLIPLQSSADNAQPALRALLPEANRAALRAELQQTTSPGGRAILLTLDLQDWKHFSPVGTGGGQPLETTILLIALLHESAGLAPSLADEIAALAHASRKSRNLATLEAFYLDALSIAQRLDGATIEELLRRVQDLSTVAQYAHFANRPEVDFPLIYTAAVMSANPRGVADYIVRFGDAGIADLGQAIALGDQALHALLDKPARIGRGGTSANLGETARIAREHPTLLLLAKFAMFLLGSVLFVAGWDGIRANPELATRGPAATLQPLRNGLIGLLFALILSAVSEPFLLKANSQSDYAAEKRIIPVEKPEETPSNPIETEAPSMFDNLDLTTILTIAAFLLIQFIVYLICIQRIHQIDRLDKPPLLKIKLMENEDNLFDAGLYVGIAGTALALVLQVMDVIRADLIAAYSSNLFGITCVALVKIRNVRPYKRKLILETEDLPKSTVRRAQSDSEPAEQPELLT